MADKNKYGQYFTISLISDFMTSLLSHKPGCKVLEPSCGKGVFLDSLKKAGYNNLFAYEIDKSLNNPHDFVRYQSFLSVPTTEKYDVIIGNPPYIRWKNIEPELKKELESNQLWNQYFNSLCDYLFIFILKSIEHLEEDGELVFICTDYWMNTTHSISLRNYMCSHGYFTDIYQFKEAALFEKVTASFIIFKYVKSKERKATINLHKYTKDKGLPTENELKTRDCFQTEKIPSFSENSRWILATKKIQDELENFEKVCEKQSEQLFEKELYRIGDYCEIGNGMVSGLDKAFQISEIDELNNDEKKSLIKVIKAKDLCQYKFISHTNYIFLQNAITEEKFKAKFPHFAVHFEPHLEKLSKRYSYNREIPYWEFVFPRNQKLFERKEPRIFIPCKERISNKNFFRFCYASDEYYPTQDVTAIFKKSNTKESIEYILAYLNNKRVFDWLSYNGIVKGAIVEFSEAPIASIPFRPINWTKKEEVTLHNEITKLVKDFFGNENYDVIDEINNKFNVLFNEKY